MTTVADILQWIEGLAPGYMQEHWDNVGLLCGRADASVSKILVALDPFEHVCQEAADEGAQLLITHHPLIFQPTKAITDETSVGRCIQLLCAHGISAVNAHTNLDCAPGGINDVLAQALDLQDISVIEPAGNTETGLPFGLLRSGCIPQQTLPQFLAHVQKALGCEGLRYTDGMRPVHRVAVGGGACGSALLSAFRAGCDTFVTSDIKYNQFWDAHDLGINLIDAGHFQTENVIIPVLAAKLSAAFPEITVLISKTHQDCMKFFR